MICSATQNLDIASKVTYCRSFFRRALGFMCRRSLREEQAYIFFKRRESLTATAITMLFVLCPIAVIWLNSYQRLVDKALARPWRLIYAPNSPARYYIAAHRASHDRIHGTG